jgi:hypothetical protein
LSSLFLSCRGHRTLVLFLIFLLLGSYLFAFSQFLFIVRTPLCSMRLCNEDADEVQRGA